MGDAPTKEQKVVFAIGDDKQTLILGVSEAAWQFMREGMTHTFDLRSFGVPVRIVMFGGPTREAIMKTLSPTIDEDTLDVSGLDMGFGGE